jgi:hypothetical protein
MSKITKQFKIENFDRINDLNGLYWLYLCDTQNGTKPDTTEEGFSKDNGNVRIQLYRATCASGGYVVIREGSYPTIMLLDDAVRQYSDNHSPYTLALRSCLEICLRVRRNLLDAKYGRVEVSNA